MYEAASRRFWSKEANSFHSRTLNPKSERLFLSAAHEKRTRLK